MMIKFEDFCGIFYSCEDCPLKALSLDYSTIGCGQAYNKVKEANEEYKLNMEEE